MWLPEISRFQVHIPVTSTQRAQRRHASSSSPSSSSSSSSLSALSSAAPRSTEGGAKVTRRWNLETSRDDLWRRSQGHSTCSNVVLTHCGPNRPNILLQSRFLCSYPLLTHTHTHFKHFQMNNLHHKRAGLCVSSAIMDAFCGSGKIKSFTVYTPVRLELHTSISSQSESDVVTWIMPPFTKEISVPSDVLYWPALSWLLRQ